MTSKIAAGITLVTLLLVGGCASSPTQTIEGSRHELYASLDELIAASTEIVVGTADTQMEVEGGEVGFTETSTRLTVKDVAAR